MEGNTPKDKMIYLDQILDDYEVKLGLPQFVEDKNYEDIGKYLNLSRDELEALDQEACASISYRLNAFALHLSRSYNREIARVKWAEDLISEVIATEIQQYNGYGYKEKAPQAIKNNDYANNLNKIKRYAQQRSDRIGYLSHQIKNMADSIKYLKWSKSDGT